jgi:hypothetical protein
MAVAPLAIRNINYPHETTLQVTRTGEGWQHGSTLFYMASRSAVQHISNPGNATVNMFGLCSLGRARKLAAQQQVAMRQQSDW